MTDDQEFLAKAEA